MPQRERGACRKRARYGETAWWYLLHTRDLLKKYPRRRAFPPIQPDERRAMRAVRKLIDGGIFTEVRTDKKGRLFYTARLPKVLEAIRCGTVRDPAPWKGP